MKKHESLTSNSQSNGTIECMHQALADALHTFEMSNQEIDELDSWTPFLSAAAFAIRSAYHVALQASPSQLVFRWDTLLPLKFKEDWARVKQ